MSSKRAAHEMTFGKNSQILKNLRMNQKPKTPKQLERHLKGVANHWRIAILLTVANQDGVSLDQICQSVSGNIKTISEHTRRLVLAGLLEKKYHGSTVEHHLTPYGKTMYSFLSQFSNS